MGRHLTLLRRRRRRDADEGAAQRRRNGAKKCRSESELQLPSNGLLGGRGPKPIGNNLARQTTSEELLFGSFPRGFGCLP